MNRLLRKRAEEAPEKEEPKQDEPVTTVKETVQQRRIREYADDHRSEIWRSDESAPERFRDLRPIEGEYDLDDFLVPQLISGSRFSGHSVHWSNYTTFLKLYGDQPGVFNLDGGYDAYGVAVRLADISKDMLNTLLSMDQYASLDDEEVARVELEAISDAWEDWGRHDFLRAIEREFPDKEAEIDAMTDTDLLELFETLRQRLGAQWVHETGNRSYIDVDRIAETCKAADIPSRPAPKRVKPEPEEYPEEEAPEDTE